MTVLTDEQRRAMAAMEAAIECGESFALHGPDRRREKAAD
jgi:hypothetical protein